MNRNEGRVCYGVDKTSLVEEEGGEGVQKLEWSKDMFLIHIVRETESLASGKDKNIEEIVIV